LTWVDQLIDDVRTLFVRVYKDQLQKPNATACTYPFDSYYDKEMERLDQTTGGAVTAEPPRISVQEKKANPEERDTGGPPPPDQPLLSKAQQLAVSTNGDSIQSTPAESPNVSRPTTPLPGIAPHLVAEKARPGSRGSRRSRKAANATNPSSDTESKKTKTSTKKGRVWGPDGLADEDDGRILDYSSTNDQLDRSRGAQSPPPEAIEQESWGSKNKKGQFVLKDLDDEVDSILKDGSKDRANGVNGSGSSTSRLGAISGYFRNIVGGKTMTKQDLDKPLKAMEEHLINKNVARDAAIRLCEGVESEMVGKKTAAFESTDAALRPALEASLRKIMTPKGSLDLLQQVESVTKPSSSNVKSRPFVIAILGVNGVGKSTNLSKLCYFLLQNNYRVLIAAGDTFRSGAVEQLNVHVRNLKELTARENLGAVDIYEKGYGKDAANVAKDAVAYADANNYQVVLIDTAGRAHTNTQLMAALEKLVDFAKPDLILQVAEALVGNDSVGQAQNFTRALGKGRRLDGFIVSKIDTIGDACGTIVSLVHATGVPVQFIGVGQHYGDLRTLSVPWAVKMLMN
jgi:signal recognition particle receptor subunit alpha